MALDPASPALGLNVGSSDGSRPAFFASGESLPVSVGGKSLPRGSFGESGDVADVIRDGVLNGCGTDVVAPPALTELSGLEEPDELAEAPASDPAVGAVDVAAVFASGLLLNRSVELDGAAGLAAAPAAAAA